MKFSKKAFIFKELFKLESKRMVNRRNILILALFIVAGLYFVQAGIAEYRLLETEARLSAEARSSSAGQAGIPLFFPGSGEPALYFSKPDAAAIFFGPSKSPQPVEVNLDSIESIETYASLVKKSILDSLRGDFKNFSGFLLVCGSLLFLFFGRDACLNREYLKFIRSASGSSDLYSFAVYFVRFFALYFVVSLVFNAAVWWAGFNGIEFSGSDLELLRSLKRSAADVFFFFYVFGVFFGTLRSRRVRTAGIALCWLAAVFILPGLIERDVTTRVQRTAVRHLLKLNELKADFRNKPEVVGDCTQPGWVEAKNNESRWYARMELRAARLGREIFTDYEAIMNDYLDLSAYLPTTYYAARIRGKRAGGDLVSRMKARFSPWLQDLTRTDGEGNNVAVDLGDVPFGDQLFARADVKQDRRMDILQFIILYPAIFLFLCVVSAPGIKYCRGSDLDISVGSGEKGLFHAPPGFVQGVYNRLCFSGRSYLGELQLLGKDFQELEAREVIYLPDFGFMPGSMKVRSLWKFFHRVGRLADEGKEALEWCLRQRLEERRGERLKVSRLDVLDEVKNKCFADLDMEERVEVLLTLVRFMDYKIYMLSDAVGSPASKATRRMKAHIDDFCGEGGAVLYFNTDPHYTPPLGFDKCEIIYEEEGKYKQADIK